MTINYNNGSITLSEIYNNYLVSRTYYGYSRQQAKRMFKEYLTTLSSNYPRPFYKYDKRI